MMYVRKIWGIEASLLLSPLPLLSAVICPPCTLPAQNEPISRCLICLLYRTLIVRC